MEGLRTIEWLRDLSESQWATLQSRATRHQVETRATVFAPTPDPHSVYLLERGWIRILRISREGDEVTLGYVKAGEVFGELPGFGDHPRESFAVARVPSLVWKIPITIFRELIAAQPTITVEIARQMSDRMKRVESRVENLVFSDVRSRLVTILLELGDDFGRRDGNCCVIDLGLSQGELATLIGTTRQSVNAAMGQLRNEGLLRLTGRCTELLDLKELQRIGEPRNDSADR